jgi:sulfoxide reductase heme-binding subunit YedZ
VYALVWAACALPLAKVGLDAAGGRLGANPIEAILNRFGFWTLTFLMLSLAPTALRIVTGWGGAVRYRRTIGLFAFAYACLHFATYLVLDQFFDVAAILEDIAKRPFITVGFAALVLLVPLAVTSNDRAVRRLGFVRWQRWHRLVYAAAVLGVVHFIWRVKADLQVPLVFATVLAVLLGLRVLGALRRRGLRQATVGVRG